MIARVPTTSAKCRRGMCGVQECLDSQFPDFRRTKVRYLTTGGGLVFSGAAHDREVRAFDAKPARVLCKVPDQFRESSVNPRRSPLDGVRVRRGPVRLGRRFTLDAGGT